MKAEPLKNKFCNNFDRNKFSVREGHIKLFQDKDINSAAEWLKNQIPIICVDLLSIDEERIIKKIDESFEDVIKK